MQSGYRELPHTADVALEVWGRDLPDLFAQAGRGLSDLLAHLPPDARPEHLHDIRLSAPDNETLLIDWLNELLTFFDEHGEAYVTFDVAMPHPGELTARVGATPRYTPRHAIKAATFHNLAIRQEQDGGYRTVVVFDV